MAHFSPLCSPLTPAEVLKLITSSSLKYSPVDIVPVQLIKSCPLLFAEIISVVANLSFTHGRFPSDYKQTSITPILKKSGLDSSVPANYRPISNLSTVAKIIERLFLSRIQKHVFSCSNFNKNQSAYCRYHSTETALLSTLDHLIHAADCGKSTLLVSLDLSAAFDTIDHNILLNRLHHSFGISGSVHQWLESYLVGRTQFVRLGSFTSDPVDLTCGVPQGSGLGPLLFTIYTSPISHITSSYGVNQQQYADDTQLFIALSPGDHLNEIANLESCLQSLSIWFSLNGLALNSS